MLFSAGVLGYGLSPEGNRLLIRQAVLGPGIKIQVAWGPWGKVCRAEVSVGPGGSMSDGRQPQAMVMSPHWRAVPVEATRTQSGDGESGCQLKGLAGRCRAAPECEACVSSLSVTFHLASSVKRQACLPWWISLLTLVIA